VYGWWHLLQTGADSASVRPLVQIRYGHAHNASNFPVPLLGLGGAGGRCRRGKPRPWEQRSPTRPEFAAAPDGFQLAQFSDHRLAQRRSLRGLINGVTDMRVWG
jgi:hypothetical protein